MSIEEKIRKTKQFELILKKAKKGELVKIFPANETLQDIIVKFFSKRNSIIYLINPKNDEEEVVKKIKTVKDIKYNELISYLTTAFKRVEKVLLPGEFSIKGDVICFWQFFLQNPIRINFFGDQIEQIELFDEVTLRAIKKLDFIPVVQNPELLIQTKIYSVLNEKSLVKVVFSSNFSNDAIRFDFEYPDLFFSRLDLLQKQIEKYEKERFSVYIAAKNSDKIPAHLRKFIINEKFKTGLISSQLKIALFTDSEIFSTLNLNQKRFGSRKSKFIYEFANNEIEIGDFIVHEDYGIGIYNGILQKTILGQKINYIEILYAQKDKLSVPINQISKVSKFIGVGGSKPQITRLGSGMWKRITGQVKASSKSFARELLSHLAKDQISLAVKLEKSNFEEELKKSFEFDETEDQLKTIDEVLTDLESGKKMNRLIVGDVGFGKTEVAIRAIFRSFINGYQSVILAPTTILVSQHLVVLKKRLGQFGARIESLSRFSSSRKNHEIIEKIKNGEIDIVVGTHRLLSNDVKFKNLALIVIDEEQKFGVKQKEKIRKQSYSAHTLYLSATPIPRSLALSLSRVRDISIIATPPKDRFAVITRIDQFDYNLIAKAIRFEKKRGGQVFFLHNRVNTIESLTEKLKSILKDVRFEFAHGQMHPKRLEKVMYDFINKKFDCLVATSIIENGLDIKNANTLIVDNADQFGLSDLYQIRGRIGRGKRQAYCYLLLRKTVKTDSNAYKRLSAINEAKVLGSGFSIASKDLEIRGAGNFLGKEQHGNVMKVGLSLYLDLLEREVERLNFEIEKNKDS